MQPGETDGRANPGDGETRDAALTSSAGEEDRQPDPPKWRRWLPAWLRSLFWIDGAASYDAFLSYSWKADFDVAPAIQRSLQQNFRPWYRTRARNIFRDLACLPAGSNLEKELAIRLDRSRHLIVLASTSSAQSDGMEFEGDHWFKSKRAGEVIVLVTAGTYKSWSEIANSALPASIRQGLKTTPLWIDLSGRREALIAHPDDPKTGAELRNDLRQLFLRLHDAQDWDQLQGEERAQRVKLLRYVTGVAVLFAVLGTIAFIEYLTADRNATTAQKAAAAEAAARKEVELQRDQFQWQSLMRESVRYSSSRADDDLAALLAREAFMIFKRAPAPMEYLVEDALQKAAQMSPRGHQFVGHTSRVYEVAFSPNGKLLASASIDGTVRVWNPRDPTKQPAVLANTFSPPAELTDSIDTRALTSVAISHDGARLSAAAADGTLLLWDLNRLTDPPRVVDDFYDAKSPRPKLVLRPHTSSFAVDFSPDSRRLARVSGDMAATGLVELWNLEQPRAKPVLLRGDGNNTRGLSPSNVAAVRFSPDGAHLASVDNDQFVRVWDLHKPGSAPIELKGSEGSHSVAFSPTGDSVATGGDDKIVRVWQLSNPEKPVEFKGHEDTVWSVAYSPNGEALASSGSDNTIRIWTPEKPDTDPIILRHQDRVASVAFSADSAYVAAAGWDRRVTVWDLRHAEQPPTFRSKPHLPDITVQALVNDFVGALSIAPDGSRMASSSNGGDIQIWDMTKPSAPPQVLLGHGHWVRSLAFSSDGTRLVSASQDKTVRVWDAHDPRRAPVVLRQGDDPVRYAAFSPDSRLVVSGGNDRIVRIWDLSQPRSPVRALKGHTAEVTSVLFLKDGTRIASGSIDGTVRIWNLKTPDSQPVVLQTGEFVKSIAFSPDERQIGAGSVSGKVRVWNMARLEAPPAILEAPKTYGTSIAFSPSGTKLASASSNDGLVRLFDLRYPEAPPIVFAPPDGELAFPVNSVSFFPDGTRLAAINSGAVVRIWPLWESAAESICGRVWRNLSAEEWKFYMGDRARYRKTCPELPGAGERR